MSAARAVFVGILVGMPAIAHGQRDTLAQLSGQASSSRSGAALSGVMVAVPAVRAFAVTDSTGRFELAGLPAGRQKVRIAYNGRETEEYELELRPGRIQRLAIVLDAEAVDLAPIVVEGRATYWRRDLAGFFERKKWYGGFGRFFTQDDIERLRPTSLSTLLARAGVFERCIAAGCVPTTFARGRTCVVPVSVDGMPFWETDYDNIPVEEVVGVEVYRGGAFGVPPDLSGLGMASSFARTALGRPAPVCGAIGIWTR